MAQVGNNAADNQLKLFVDRIERINEDIKEMQDDRKDVFAEAKAMGYDPRTIREVIRVRKLEPQVREERKMLLDTYLAAFGID